MTIWRKDKVLLLIVALISAGLAHLTFHYLDQYVFDVIAALLVIYYGSRILAKHRK